MNPFFIGSFRRVIHLLGALVAGLTLTAAEPSASRTNALNPAQLESLIQQNHDLVVLDVREAKDHVTGHLKQSINVDARSADFKERLAKLDRSKTYVVHCVRGLKRTDDTVVALTELGFTHILTLQGGINAWIKDGKPLEKDPTSAAPPAATTAR